MKRVALVALVVVSAAGPAVAAAVDVKLTARLPVQLPFLYPDLELEIVNTSSDSVFVPKGAFQVSMFIQAEEGYPENAFPARTIVKTENGWGVCQSMSAVLPSAGAKIEWEEIAAGEKHSVPIPGNLCLAQMNQSGTFRIKVRLSSPYGAPNQGPPPARTFQGTHESNVIELRVKEPTGIDAEAVAWAKGSPMKPEVLEAFPSSEYAAFLLWPRVGYLERGDPVKTQSLMGRGLYPGPNSVPDPTVPGNWRSVDNAGMARWQVEWGQRLLREHPEFPYRDQVEVGVALAQMSLGKTDEGLRTLRELAQKDGLTASWSRNFLDARVEKLDK